MKPNPGGQLAPDEIVGRDALVADLWEVLAGRNIYMNDLRRIGKTMFLNKMAASPPEGWLISKRDLGGIRKAAEFATQVYRDSLALLNPRRRGLRRMGEMLGRAAGTEIVGLLKLLVKDHYLKRDSEGQYEFRLRIVHRWWVLDRGLLQETPTPENP